MNQTSNQNGSVSHLTICDGTLWGLFQIGTSQVTNGNLIRIAEEIEKLRADQVLLPYLDAVPHRDIDWCGIGQVFDKTEPVIVVSDALPASGQLQEYAQSMNANEYQIRLSSRVVSSDLKAWLEELENEGVSIEQQFECEVEITSDDLLDELTRLHSYGTRKIILVDRKGALLPTQVEAIFNSMPDYIVKGLSFSVQFRNDMGVAVANSLISLNFDASGVDCSIMGVGPYTGWTPLEEIVVTLELHHEQYGYRTKINHSELVKANELVSELTGLGLVPNKPVSGENIFATEAGIHQDGLLKNPDTYLPFRPELVGADGIQLVIGRHSGRRAVQHRLGELGIEVEDDEVLEVLEMIKQLPKGQKVDNEILTEFASRLKSA